MIGNKKIKIPKRIRLKKQKWDLGDYFIVPLLNGEFGLGQAIDQIDFMGGVVCVLFDIKVKDDEEAVKKIKNLSEENIISVTIPSGEALEYGDWKVVYHDKPWQVKQLLKTTKNVKSSGIIDDFYNAYHGLAPWGFRNTETHYNNMLVSPKKKPKNLIYVEDCDKWWSELDYFLVPLEDGEYGVGQILKKESEYYTIKIILFDIKVKNESEALTKIKTLTEKNIFSATTVERDWIDEKKWKMVKKPSKLNFLYDAKKLEKKIKDNDFDGYRTPAVITRLYNAYHKLDSWDIPYNPKDYLDKLLISPDKKPKDVIYRFPLKN